MGGSMGQVVGEKFVQAANVALAERIPLVCFSASGGARMQEAILSLMQMSKTAAVLERMKQEGIPYISVMTDPVFGGVSASLAMLGDLNIAEPNALVAFAGPRVVRDTVGKDLPEGFQRSEFVLEHGFLDYIVERKNLKEKIALSIIRKHRLWETFLVDKLHFNWDEVHDIAEQLGISKTPIREALQLLEQDNLVKIFPAMAI